MTTVVVNPWGKLESGWNWHLTLPLPTEIQRPFPLTNAHICKPSHIISEIQQLPKEPWVKNLWPKNNFLILQMAGFRQTKQKWVEPKYGS